MSLKHGIYIVLSLLPFFTSRIARAVGDYDMGNPTLQDIWVDPVSGKDAAGRGSVRSLAFKSIQFALNYVPSGQELNNTGFRILLVPGLYPASNVPSTFSGIIGTHDYPVIVQAADDTGSVILPSLNISECKYFYLIGLTVTHGAGSSASQYAVSFRGGDHVLIRNCRLFGADSTSLDTATAGVIFYQTPYAYIEQSEVGFISQQPDVRPSGIGIDAYASQYGHIKRCTVHDLGGQGVVIRGGSAYYTVEENVIAHGGGGIQIFVRDTNNGLDNMISPWIHYDAYDVKCINNVIHHTSGPGFSCSGGYNILFAFNTLYKTGTASSLLAFSQAQRATWVARDVAQALLDSGGWGTSYWYTSGQDSDIAPIPNKNIFVYNNVFANPDDSATLGPHLSVSGPKYALAVNARGPRPAASDDNLVIKGNIIWNGPVTKPTGINSNSGCGDNNPTCNDSLLSSENMIHFAKPAFVDTSYENYRPTPSSLILTTATAKTFPIPDFSWSLTAKPVEPEGTNSNRVATDKDSNIRNSSIIIPGAFIRSTSSVSETSLEETRMDIYPNPSYGESAIKIHTEYSGYMTLQMYDALGKQMTPLLSGTLGSGDHVVLWNARNLGGGTYYCRLSSGGSVVTKKIILIR